MDTLYIADLKVTCCPLYKMFIQMFAIQGDSNNGFTIGKLKTIEDTKY